MTSNKEFIPQTKETLTKIDEAKALQFNPDAGSFRKLLGIKEYEMVPLSFARTILNGHISGKKNGTTLNNPTCVEKSQLRLNTEVSK
jgi:hypothetical protein